MTPPLKGLHEEIEVNLENVTTLTDKELDIAITEKQRRILANLSDSKKKKDELTPITDNKELTQDSVEECPFPEHRGYTILWNNLKNDPEGQKQMKENFRISDDRKIEVIKMKKKFSILQAEHNGKDIYKGEHKDQYGKKGIAGVTYLTSRAAEKVCKEQNKELLNGKGRLEEFISYFPGVDEKEKCRNFVQLFGLEKAGFWHMDDERWVNVDLVGYANLSRVLHRGSAYGVRWNDNDASIVRDGRGYPSPYVVYEPCAA